MRRILFGALLAVVLVAAAACGDDTDTGTTPGAAEPWGRTFVATEGVPVRLTFTDDGEVRARIECNTLLGSASIDGDVLQVDNVGSTEMGCDPALHEQDEWLADLLTSRPTIALDGDTLTLTGAADTLVLLDREVAEPDQPLEGTRWVVDGLVDGDAVSSLPAGAGEAWLTFAGGRVEGQSGCNDFSGPAEVGEGTITIGEVVTTDVACDEATMTVEAAMYAALDGEVTYEIEASTLWLTGPDGHGLTLHAEST